MYVRKCKSAHQNTKASPLDSGLNELEPRKEMLPLRRQHALLIAGEEFKYPGIFFGHSWFGHTGQTYRWLNCSIFAVEAVEKSRNWDLTYERTGRGRR